MEETKQFALCLEGSLCGWPGPHSRAVLTEIVRLPPGAELFLGGFCLSVVTAWAGLTGREHAWGCGRAARPRRHPARMTRREGNARNGL